MTRPIKFRVWQDYRKEPEPNLGLGYFEFDLIDKEDCAMFANERKDSATIAVCQFTGLCDKNGREIYEGDILRRDGYEEDIMAVLFHKGMFGWWDYIDGREFTVIAGWEPEERLEIIGNIYQNPELVEAAK